MLPQGAMSPHATANWESNELPSGQENATSTVGNSVRAVCVMSEKKLKTKKMNATKNVFN